MNSATRLMGEVDSGCLAGFGHVGGASRPPKVPLTGSVRGEEQRGEGVVVDGEWSRAGDRRGPSLAHRRRSNGGGGGFCVRKRGEAEEREGRESERGCRVEREGGSGLVFWLRRVWGFGPLFLFGLITCFSQVPTPNLLMSLNSSRNVLQLTPLITLRKSTKQIERRF